MVKTCEEDKIPKLDTKRITVCNEVDIKQLVIEWERGDGTMGRNYGYEEANRMIVERFGDTIRIHTVRLGPKPLGVTKVDSKISQWIVNIYTR